MSDSFNIFISWSGSRSKWVAEALRDWLPVTIQAARPWMSSTDIEKGSRGLNEVSSRLTGTKVGIVCLTPENLNAPWILYEAGALSKTIDENTRLCTYLLGGLEFQDVAFPLGMFQATKATREETRGLVRTINHAVSEPLISEPHLEKLFERMWPDLEQKISAMPRSDQAAPSKRPVEDMVTEMLEIARAETNARKSMEAQISHIGQVLNRAPFGDLMYSTLSVPGITGMGYPPVKSVFVSDLAVEHNGGVLGVIGTPAQETEDAKSEKKRPKK